MQKLTIIVPVYNSELYLKKCLNSLLNQTLKDIEIICVNDGSTDGSLDILKSFAQKDSRIKIIDKKMKVNLLQEILQSNKLPVNIWVLLILMTGWI